MDCPWWGRSLLAARQSASPFKSPTSSALRSRLTPIGRYSRQLPSPPPAPHALATSSTLAPRRSPTRVAILEPSPRLRLRLSISCATRLAVFPCLPAAPLASPASHLASRLV